MIDKVYKLLASKKFALYLFLGISLFLIPKTFFAQSNLYLDSVLQAVLGLLAANLAFCTIRRFRYLSVPNLFIHIGTIVTLVGGLISGFGYIATINIYEGSSVDSVFRWDVEEDIPLGFDMKVKKIRREFYPVPVQVGILFDGKEAGLQTLKTGDSFQWQAYRILVDSLDLEKEILVLNVYDKNKHLVGVFNTNDETGLPTGFPLEFKLVAYRDPVVKNVGADLVFLKNNKVLAEGLTRVNDPFKWRGLKFHITNVDKDQHGFPFVGIQIVEDQGVYLVYIGFILICFGCLVHLHVSFRKKS
jgi:hypothetical protein